MKNMIIATIILFSATLSFADTMRLEKSNYSKYMFLLLDCVTRSGLQTNYKVSDQALDFCVSETNVNSRVDLVFTYTPSLIAVELDQYHFTTRDLIACLGGERGKKTSDDLSIQNANDQRVIKECKDIVDPTAAGINQALTQ